MSEEAGKAAQEFSDEFTAEIEDLKESGEWAQAADRIRQEIMEQDNRDFVEFYFPTGGGTE